MLKVSGSFCPVLFGLEKGSDQVERYEQAEQDYMDGMKYKDIAEKYKTTMNTVKSWKKRYGWDRKRGVVKKITGKAIPKKESIQITNVQWKMLPGYDGKYIISNTGIVMRRRKDGAYVEAKTSKSNKGYVYFKTWFNGTKKTMSLHRTVAECFIRNPLKLPEVNHIDENKENNSTGNLEWCTALYNNCYGSRLKKQVMTRTAVGSRGE